MATDIDKSYNFINEHDALAATIWLDRKYWFLTFNEIGQYLNISPSRAKQLYKRANYILDHKDEVWTDGLSNRSRFALLRHGFRDLATLVQQLKDCDIELREIEGVGEAVESEITDWLNQKGYLV